MPCPGGGNKMRIQTGIDLCSIERMRTSLNIPRFFEFVFSPAEQAMLYRRGSIFRPAAAAANFAVKEAFAKALGTGVRGFSLREVQVLRDSLGCPFLELTGRAKQIAAEQGLSFSVSISHEQDMAAAVVVAYRE